MAKAYVPPAPLTDDEYRAELKIVAREVEEANYFFQINEAMNELLLNDPGFFMAASSQSEFWQAHRGATQASLFMAIWRILESKNDKARGIHTLLRLTIRNLHIFSKAALAKRRMAGETKKPWWFDDFLSAAWEPASSDDLRFLREALKPHARLFEEVYEPIRHQVYGHRLMSDLQAGDQLFPKTNRVALGEIIFFLQNLVDDLEHLFNNGRKPTLSRDFSSRNERIREKVREAMGWYVSGWRERNDKC